MANSRTKTDNYDVVGGVFDFIFKEAKKPPQARRPIKPPEYVSLPDNQELADAMVAALMLPGTLVTDATIKEWQGALDLELARVPFNETGGIVKLTTSNIGQFFKDPKGFIDKSVKTAQAQRKAGRAAFLGSFMTDFVTTAWAHKYGDEEAKKITLANSTANAKEEESRKVRKALGQFARTHAALPVSKTQEMKTPYMSGGPTDLNFMADRSLDLIGRKTFGKGWEGMLEEDKMEFASILSGGTDPLDIVGQRTLGSRWGTMSAQQKQQAKQKMSQSASKGNSKENIEKYIVTKYGVVEAKKFARAASGSAGADDSFSEVNRRKRNLMQLQQQLLRTTDINQQKQLRKEIADEKAQRKAIKFEEGDKIDIFDPTLYRTLERNYLTEKIATSTGPEKAKYQRILLVMEANKRSLNEHIKTLEQDLSVTSDPVLKRQLKEEIKEGKKARDVMNINSVFGRIGQVEGYVGSLRNIWIPTEKSGLLRSIWSQDFFDSRKNTILNPVVDMEIGDVKGDRNDKISFKVAKRLGDVESDKKLLNLYNQGGELLYYINPKTWGRSLVTGEGFAWIANRNKESAMSMIKDLPEYAQIQKYTADFLSSSSNIQDIKKEITNIMNQIKLSDKQKTLSPAQIQKIESLLNRTGSFKRLTNIFSAPLRLKNRVESQIQRRIIDATKELRTKLVRGLLKNKAVKDLLVKYGGKEATKLIGKFITQGSIKALVQGFATAIAGALGLSAAGVGAIVTTVITWIVTEVIYRVGRVVLGTVASVVKISAQFFALIVLGLIGILFMVFSGATKSVSEFNAFHFSAKNAVPDTVITCDEYGLIDPIIHPDADEDPGPSPEPGDTVPPELPDECVEGEDIQDVMSRAEAYVSDTYAPVSKNLYLVNCDEDKGEVHYMCESIAWAWCYSGSDGIYCKADEIASASCEYLFDLFTHELMHQIQGAGCSTDMREWGADYLSNNGGSYSFETADGCKEATEISAASCSDEDIINAALCWDNTTQCYQDIESQINGRFCE